MEDSVSGHCPLLLLPVIFQLRSSVFHWLKLENRYKEEQYEIKTAKFLIMPKIWSMFFQIFLNAIYIYIYIDTYIDL